MLLPIAAIHGSRWSLASSGFLFGFAVLMTLYFLAIAIRTRSDTFYLVASLASLAAIFFSSGTAWSPSGSSWQIFLIALGFALYAVDRIDRARRVAVLAPK